MVSTNNIRLFKEHNGIAKSRMARYLVELYVTLTITSIDLSGCQDNIPATRYWKSGLLISFQTLLVDEVLHEDAHFSFLWEKKSAYGTIISSLRSQYSVMVNPARDPLRVWGFIENLNCTWLAEKEPLPKKAW